MNGKEECDEIFPQEEAKWGRIQAQYMGPFHVQVLQIPDLARLLLREAEEEDPVWGEEECSYTHHKLSNSTCSSGTQNTGQRPLKVSCLFHLSTVIIVNTFRGRNIVR